MKVISANIGLCLLLVRGLWASTSTLEAAEGGTVTLPCTYSVKDGTTTMCWGRGRCPNNWCNDEIIQTNGLKETKKKSDRYQLLGDLSLGDVSLTVKELTKTDEGLYCCRVEIPGWFNDQKHEITLTVHEAIKSTISTHPEHSPVPSHAPDEEFSQSGTVTDSFWTISGIANQRQKLETEELEASLHSDSITPVVAGMVTIVLLVALVGVLAAWRYYKIRNQNKTRNTRALTLDNLHGRERQVEQNIYSL